jgi:hypothetical protein
MSVAKHFHTNATEANNYFGVSDVVGSSLV